jgi:alpha-glucosidase
MDNETIKEYIYMAAAQEWPYMLIDWQWYGAFNKPEADITKPAPQLDMPALLSRTAWSQFFEEDHYGVG